MLSKKRSSRGEAKPTLSSQRPILYFRQSPHMGTLVFAPPKRAELIDQLHRAIEESTTWGEFRRRVPKDEYKELFADVFSTDPEELEEDEELREPGDREEFSCDVVPGYSDGDYPPWVAAEMERYLPDSVIETYGKTDDSMVNGSFLAIDAANREKVLEALKSEGFEVVEREDLQFW